VVVVNIIARMPEHSIHLVAEAVAARGGSEAYHTVGPYVTIGPGAKLVRSQSCHVTTFPGLFSNAFTSPALDSNSTAMFGYCVVDGYE
jgi:hypothetical protein